MSQSALLLLSGPIRSVVESVGQYLNNANKRVVKRIYVKLEPAISCPLSKNDHEYVKKLSFFVPVVYDKATSVCKSIDVRVLLANTKHSRNIESSNVNFDVILTNIQEDEHLIRNYVGKYISSSACNIIKLDNGTFPNFKNESDDFQLQEIEVYRNVCLGGTFDRLHNGHKVLLSEAILRAKEKVIIGVSDAQTIKKKVLWELIEPIEKRIEEVSKFLFEVDPSLKYDVVPISDPYGPAITDPDIDCIIVTTETKIGGQKINIERKNREMHELDMVVVDLVGNCDRSAHEDEKVSSSTNRMKLLGKPLKSTLATPSENKLYCILFRGHFLSGKSFIASRFQLSGLPVLCCDEILRAIISKDCDLQEKLMEKISCCSSTDKVFEFDKIAIHCWKNKKDKEWFSQLIFSKMKSSLHQVLNVYMEQGANIVLIKDSTIFEEYDLEFSANEIWATVLPVSESLKKLKELYKVSEDEAYEIINSLPSNQQYVETANILFCNMWSTDAVQEQVDRAWSYINSVKKTILPKIL